MSNDKLHLKHILGLLDCIGEGVMAGTITSSQFHNQLRLIKELEASFNSEVEPPTLLTQRIECRNTINTKPKKKGK